ncbi:hypothetical protein Avbf_13001 [Armadillidium vulgare]|nr:hypothetical protein Avbf_13001 [Armadillidium vulgare]
MGKREDNRKLKLCILAKIKENKKILFGAFSDSISKKSKVEAWKQVTSYAHSLGGIPAEKDFTYVRDIWWPNIRKTAITRKDNITRTGTGGGADCKLTDVDEEVLTIIGKDSASICGLDVLESMEEVLSSEQYEPELILIEETSVASRNLPTESVPSTSTCQPAECEKPPSSSTYTTKSSEISLGTSRTSDFRRNPQKKADFDNASLYRKKLELTVSILEKENYLKSLEILKLEKELMVQNSRFTKDLVFEETTLIIDSETLFSQDRT